MQEAMSLTKVTQFVEIQSFTAHRPHIHKIHLFLGSVFHFDELEMQISLFIHL